MNVESGWIIANGGEGDALRYRGMPEGLLEWVTNPLDALRFARRIDAERFCMEDEDAWRIIEYSIDSVPDKE